MDYCNFMGKAILYSNILALLLPINSRPLPTAQQFRSLQKIAVIHPIRAFFQARTWELRKFSTTGSLVDNTSKP